VTIDIRTALAAHKPEIAAAYTRFAERRFADLVAHFGPPLEGVYNSTFARSYAAISNLTRRVSATSVVRSSDPLELSAERVAAAAANYAADIVEAVVAKAEAKLGLLADAKVISANGNGFTIVGTKDGRAVRIEQERIVNVSVKGLLFNQWPARIYVDGKFTSAAKFAAL